jgi:hypothetical protein
MRAREQQGRLMRYAESWVATQVSQATVACRRRRGLPASLPIRCCFSWLHWLRVPISRNVTTAAIPPAPSSVSIFPIGELRRLESEGGRQVTFVPDNTRLAKHRGLNC